MLSINPATGAPTVIGVLTGATLAGTTGLACNLLGGVGSAQVMRNGVPANPAAFLAGTQPPVLGMVWNPRIDHTTFFPAATGDFMLLSPGPLNLPTILGTLLCDLNPAVVVSKAPTANFAVPVPSSPGLLGAKVCTQGMSIDACGPH